MHKYCGRAANVKRRLSVESSVHGYRLVRKQTFCLQGCYRLSPLQNNAINAYSIKVQPSPGLLNFSPLTIEMRQEIAWMIKERLAALA